MTMLAAVIVLAVVTSALGAWCVADAYAVRRKWRDACSRAAISEAHTVAARERMEFMQREFRESRREFEEREAVLVARSDAMTERLLDTLTAAAAPPPAAEATRDLPPADAESRVREVISIDIAAQNREMQEERIAIGAKQLVEEYRRNGLTISLDEARLQAEAMLAGRSPVAEGGA